MFELYLATLMAFTCRGREEKHTLHSESISLEKAQHSQCQDEVFHSAHFRLLGNGCWRGQSTVATTTIVIRSAITISSGWYFFWLVCLLKSVHWEEWKQKQTDTISGAHGAMCTSSRLNHHPVFYLCIHHAMLYFSTACGLSELIIT